MRTVGMVLAVVAACSDPPLPDWPAPEPAAAICSYENTSGTSDPYHSTSTVYYDERARVFRVDGFVINGDRNERGTYYFEYDDLDRLLSVKTPLDEVSIDYGDVQIVVTGTSSSTWTYDLVGTQVSLVQGPTEIPEAERNRMAYEYDAAGNISRVTSAIRYDLGDGNGVQLSHSDVLYSHDDVGRVTQIDGSNRLLDFAYTQSDRELVIEVTRGGFGPSEPERVSIQRDDQARITRVVRGGGSFDETLEYTYGPGVISETVTTPVRTYSVVATGQCPAIAIDLAYAQPLPLRSSANHVRYRQRDAVYNWFAYDQLFGPMASTIPE